MAELADAQDLKSCGNHPPVPVRFWSSALIQYRGVEQLAARRAHNPKVVGSSPTSATKKYGPVGQAVKTPPFHGGNRSSILLRVTNSICGCSSMVEFWPSKPAVRVRSPSPAPKWGYSSAGRASALQAGGHRLSPVNPTK